MLQWFEVMTHTLQNPQMICKMTIANGLAKTPPNLKPNGEKGQNLQLLRMQSKFMAHHILEILSSPARQAIEQFKLVYTWTSPDRKDKEKNQLTILALVLDQIQPHYKVDMFLEIEKIKKEKLEQYKKQSRSIL